MEDLKGVNKHLTNGVQFKVRHDEEDNDIFSCNNYLKSANISYDIKEMIICTVISGDSEVTTLFGGGDKLNVYRDVFTLKGRPKFNNKRFPMASKFLYAQKMYPRCSSNYYMGFFSMFDTAITLKILNAKKDAKEDAKKDGKKDTKKDAKNDAKKDTRKDVKKSSVSKPNQETSLAQVIQK